MHLKFELRNLKQRDHLKDRRWENNIKINVNEIVCEVMEWIHLAFDMTSGGRM